MSILSFTWLDHFWILYKICPMKLKTNPIHNNPVSIAVHSLEMMQSGYNNILTFQIISYHKYKYSYGGKIYTVTQSRTRSTNCTGGTKIAWKKCMQPCLYVFQSSNLTTPHPLIQYKQEVNFLLVRMNVRCPDVQSMDLYCHLVVKYFRILSKCVYIHTSQDKAKLKSSNYYIQNIWRNGFPDSALVSKEKFYNSNDPLTQCTPILNNRMTSQWHT